MAALMADSKRQLMTATAIASLLITSWLLFSADELTVTWHIPNPHGRYASGGTLLFEYLGDLVGVHWHVFGLSLGLTLIALTIAVRLAVELDLKTTVVSAHRPLVSHYLFGLSVMAFSFLANTNFDYRWIFIIFCLPWLFVLKRDAANNRGIRRMVAVCVGLVIVWMWSEALISDVPDVLYKLLGKEPPGTWSFPVIGLSVAKQLSAWSLLTVLAAIGIKTFMIEGTYVSTMFNRFVGRVFRQVATAVRLRSISGFKFSDARDLRRPSGQALVMKCCAQRQ
jgi:hypothetical protein